MKRILLFACAAVLGLASCTKDLENRVDALENSVQSIQQQITELTEKLNKDVADLKKVVDALKENVYVTGVSEIKEDGKVVGYTITLSKGQALTIYHGTNGKDGSNGLDGTNGKDAVAPTVGVIVVDGVYYWAVNGVALTDANGNKLPVYAETNAPEFKYEDGKWWISTDGTWSPLVSAGTGDSVFADVQYNDSSVTFVLANGTEIVLPRQAAFSLNIDGNVTVIPGATVNVAYTITGATENTTVYAIADAGYSVKVEAASVSEGNLVIKTPNPLTDGKVVVFAGNNTNAAMQVLTFEEGALTLVSDSYKVAKEGGVIEVPVVTNLDYEVEVSADWITYVETKAMREETLVLNADANTGDERKATVSLTVNGTAVQTFTVVQAANAEAKYTLEDLYGEWTVTYGSARNSYTWTFGQSDDLSKGNATLVGIFGKNKHNKKVYVNFSLTSGIISIAMGQECEDDFGYTGVFLTTTEGVDTVEYTMTEKGKFGNPTATIAYLYNGSKMGKMDNISATKVDPNKLAVGNYYYADGSCTSTFDATKTLVGVVFWLGDATADDAALKATFPGCTNGLAMAVNTVDGIMWQENAASVGDWQAENMESFISVQIPYQNGATNLDKVIGFSNTQVLKAYNEANPDNTVNVYASLVEFAATTPAPAGTSGWYIPSAKEVTFMCAGSNPNAYYASGTNHMATLNGKITAAGLSKITWSYLASSTEVNATNAHAYSSSYLFNPSKDYNFTLCPVFAF